MGIGFIQLTPIVAGAVKHKYRAIFNIDEFNWEHSDGDKRVNCAVSVSEKHVEILDRVMSCVAELNRKNEKSERLLFDVYVHRVQYAFIANRSIIEDVFDGGKLIMSCALEGASILYLTDDGERIASNDKKSDCD